MATSSSSIGSSFGDLTAGWQNQLLNYLNAPATPSNINFLNAWAQQEGGAGYANTAYYNPFNTTLQAPGSTAIAGNSAGVQAYTSQQQGLVATASTLLESSYSNIVNLLRSGNASTSQLQAAVNASSWGTKFNSGSAPSGSSPSSPPPSAAGANVNLIKTPIGTISSNSNYLVRGGLILLGGLLIYAGITKLFSSDASVIEVAGSVPKPVTQFVPSPAEAIKTKQRARRAGKVERARTKVRQKAKQDSSNIRVNENKQRYQTKAEYEASKVQAKSQAAEQMYQAKSNFEASKAASQSAAAKAKVSASTRAKNNEIKLTQAKRDLERQRTNTVNARARLHDKRTAAATKSKLSRATKVTKAASEAIEA